jgi:hypothetical protein
MPPAPLTPTLRYFPPGVRKTYWMPTTANYLAPSRGELNAGTDLTAEIMAQSGWSVSSDTIDTPDMASRFTSQIPGRTNASGSDITFYLSQNSTDVRTLLPRDQAGFIVQLWEGDVTGQKMDVFPVKVTTQAVDTTVDDPGQLTISFSVTKIPATNLIIP